MTNQHHQRRLGNDGPYLICESEGAGESALAISAAEAPVLSRWHTDELRLVVRGAQLHRDMTQTSRQAILLVTDENCYRSSPVLSASGSECFARISAGPTIQ